MVVNRLVTYAYSRLYSKDKRLYWLLMGAHGATAFGEEVMDPMWENASAGGGNYVFSAPFGVYNGDPMAADALATGGLEVFKDIYWQHLVYTACGQGTLTKIISGYINQGSAMSVKALEAWTHLSQGNYKQASITMTYVEQYYVLQPRIYSGYLAKVGGYLGAKATSAIAHPDFNGRDFVAYTNATGKWTNFAVFDSRWSWLDEVLPQMVDFFRSHPEWVERRLKIINARAREIL